ncbi:MAG: class I SAM-dependent methyltransferase [Magnetococcales bacterium]|nr:class I SAM-dependent methyltransferase [Magnetococcales bacterium]NGZ25802.1 class I SAM-dependent methyltransferase [Magnetococcales bacterium]
MDKKSYYNSDDVVESYDKQRFHSPGGQYVDRQEQSAVLHYLNNSPKDVSILDLPVGTGRMSFTLLKEGFTRVTGADYSPQMLTAAAQRCGADLTLNRQDAMSTDWPDATFDIIICLRFTFHTEDIQKLLIEFHRLLKPGGRLIFDTMRWTPRMVPGPWNRLLGGRLWCYSDDRIRQLLTNMGFQELGRQAILLLPSYLYTFVPGWLLPLVAAMEKKLPENLRTKAVWAVTKSTFV